MQTIGSEDLTAGRGNKVHGNAAYGIDARGSQVIVAGNAVYGQTANNYSGINLGAGVATLNDVFGNFDGIYGGSAVSTNRVYNNANAGIRLTQYGSTADRNVVYSNGTDLKARIAREWGFSPSMPTLG